MAVEPGSSGSAAGSVPDFPRGRRLGARTRAIATYAASLLAGFVVWQYIGSIYTTTFVPSPAETWEATKELAADGTLVDSLVASGRRILIGWAIGVAVGAPVGLLMGRIQLLRRLLDPYIEFFRFIPPIAFVTLTIIWLGPGESSKVVLIVWTTVFIVTLNTIAGVLAVDQAKLRAAASLGASRAQTLVAVVLPATVPYIVTGARLAMGNSFLTIVSAEIVAAQSGLGALIWTSRNTGRTEWVFVGIIALGILGFCFDRAIRFGSTRLLGRYSVRV